MCNFLYILFKEILKQVAAWFLIPAYFCIFMTRFTQSEDQPVPMVEHPHHILDLTIYYLKACRSIDVCMYRLFVLCNKAWQTK